jgi:hypothetical protein
MGLYETIDSLPEGARVEYKSADGTTIVYELFCAVLAAST